MRWYRIALVVLSVATVPAALAAQQTATITGRILSEDGQPLGSANVVLGSLQIGVLTRPDGTYQLVVPGARFQAGQTFQLFAQLLGYRTQSALVTLSPGATLTQDFRLTIDPLRLDEIVTTGAGTLSRVERLGTARAAVDSTVVQRANEINVIQSLAGRIANVLTTQQGGEAGASTAIRIRGPKTITGTGQPLIVVDGVPTNNLTRITGPSMLAGAVSPNRASDINPEDIESIEILKGASATSIYGASAGAGGAILITTKRGKPGQTTYSFRTTAQFDEPINLVPTQMKYGVGSNGVSSACNTTNCFLSASFFSWGPELPAGTPVYDHAAELYETGNLFDNTLTVSGGSERTTFYLSAGVVRQDGYTFGDRDRYDRYTARFNGSHQLSNRLTVGASVSYVQTQGSGVARGNSINGSLLGALRTPPEFNSKNYLDPSTGLHRSWRFPQPGPTAVLNNRGFDNPFYAIFEGANTGEIGRVFGNVNANWNPLDWLNIAYTLGADYGSDDRTSASPVSSSGAAAGGVVQRWQFYDRILDSNLVANANFTLSPSLLGTVTLGQNLNETYFRQVDVIGRTLIAPEPFKLTNTVSRDPPTDSEQRRRLEGYFGQATLDVADQLFLLAGIRNDGSSSFGVNKQRAWYPKASVAWSFSQTLKLPESVITFGKLRGAFGQSGQEPALYQLQDIFLGATNPFNDFNPGSTLIPTLGGIGGLYTSTVKGNPDIEPERVSEYEGGIDLSLFGGRSDLGLTYYQTTAKNVIFAVPLAPSSGFTSQPRNAAEIENKGWEATFNVRPIRSPTVALDLGLNWARNRNMVLSLGPDTLTKVTALSASFVGSTTNLVVGYPHGVFRGFDFARCGRGLTTIGADNVGAACQGQPDGSLYIGANGFPIQDPNEQVIGDPNPDWTAGLSAELTIKGARLSAFLEHRQGGQTLNMTKASMLQYGTHEETLLRGQQRTFGEDYFPGPVVGPGAGQAVSLGESWWSTNPGLGGVGGPRAQFMEDATHTRLREISLAYTFHGDWVNRLGLSRLDAKIAGRNLVMWTDYTGFDPEPNLAGAAAGNRGIDWFVNPLSRAWVVSLGLHR